MTPLSWLVRWLLLASSLEERLALEMEPSGGGPGVGVGGVVESFMMLLDYWFVSSDDEETSSSTRYPIFFQMKNEMGRVQRNAL